MQCVQRHGRRRVLLECSRGRIPEGVAADSGGSSGGQVCAGEGHHAANLPIGVGPPCKVQGLAPSVLLRGRLLRPGLLLLNIEDFDIEM